MNNQIDLKRSELTPGLTHFLKEELNFLNTEYLTKRRLGKSIYKVQKYFKLIDETGDAISLPRGFLQNLVSFLKENNTVCTIRFDTPSFEQTSYQSQIELTSAQIPIVQTATEYDQGVIVAPSGSGKTIIGLEIIARRQLPALILVHRKQLLDQWNERLQTFLGITKAHIGQYSGTKKKLGKQITVGLLQSLARKGDLSELKDKFGTIIVDECHHIPAATFREVIAQLILAFPFSFEGKLVQYMGRLRDIGEQKTIVDYRDAQIPFLEKQFKQRERHYKKLKAQIKQL